MGIPLALKDGVGRVPTIRIIRQMGRKGPIFWMERVDTTCL